MERDTTIHHIWNGETTELAAKASPSEGGHKPGYVWLGGFRSDMTGTKAQTMVDFCQSHDLASLRFDYSGHGVSSGVFEEGCISRWVDESLAMVRELTSGPQVLVGSSMGGWVALRLVEELQKAGEADRLAGLLLIAPAPDFATELMEPEFSDDDRKSMAERGYIEEPSAYSDEPTIITQLLIEDGRNNTVLDKDLNIGVPVRILQGMADPDVPYQHALRLVEMLVHDDVTITMVRDGDHRLSNPDDLALLERTLEMFR